MPPWHPWAKFFKGKNKMAARYFKVKCDFSTNEAIFMLRFLTEISTLCIMFMNQGNIGDLVDIMSSSRSTGLFKIKNKMAARYFKVKYDFSTNEARNKCNTSFLCDFDWAIHFLYYFHDSRSSSRSKKSNLKVN